MSEDKLTHVAMSICFVPGEGWSLVEIRFNPLTGKTGEFKKLYTGETKDYMAEKYKLETINQDVFNNSGNPW